MSEFILQLQQWHINQQLLRQSIEDSQPGLWLILEMCWWKERTFNQLNSLDPRTWTTFPLHSCWHSQTNRAMKHTSFPFSPYENMACISCFPFFSIKLEDINFQWIFSLNDCFKKWISIAKIGIGPISHKREVKYI